MIIGFAQKKVSVTLVFLVHNLSSRISYFSISYNEKDYIF
jgi:hypothetical protein